MYIFVPVQILYLVQTPKHRGYEILHVVLFKKNMNLIIWSAQWKEASVMIACLIDWSIYLPVKSQMKYPAQHDPSAHVALSEAGNSL